MFWGKQTITILLNMSISAFQILQEATGMFFQLRLHNTSEQVYCCRIDICRIS